MRDVSWPTHGDVTTFRRRMLISLGSGAGAAVIGLGTAVVRDPSLVAPLVPLAVGTLLLLVLWTHGTARSAARRAELHASFAGLIVLHHGAAFQIADQPLLGDFPSRREAARTAVERGQWAIIVKAWERYYLLDAAPAADSARDERPVAFRSSAVSDVVPAITERIALGA